MEAKKRDLRVWGRLFRITFLPVMVIIFGTMAVPVLSGLHIPVSPLIWLMVSIGVATHIFWFCYGTVLNDYHDQDTDSQNPFGHTVFTEGYFTDLEKKKIIKFFAVLALVCELPQFGFIVYAHTNVGPDLAAFAGYIAVGFILATAYSRPPLWTKRRLFGATYTLMLVYVMGFLRFALLFGGWNFVALNGKYMFGICWFLFIDHAISSLSLKDIPDAFSDRKGGARTIPLVWGFKSAIFVSKVCLALTMATGILYVLFDWLHPLFLLTYLGVIIYYYLYRDMERWTAEVAKDGTYWERVPIRRKFLMYGYILNWAIWIPGFMLAFNSRLLF